MNKDIPWRFIISHLKGDVDEKEEKLFCEWLLICFYSDHKSASRYRRGDAAVSLYPEIQSEYRFAGNN